MAPWYVPTAHKICHCDCIRQQCSYYYSWLLFQLITFANTYLCSLYSSNNVGWHGNTLLSFVFKHAVLQWSLVDYSLMPRTSGEGLLPHSYFQSWGNRLAGRKHVIYSISCKSFHVDSATHIWVQSIVNTATVTSNLITYIAS